MARKSVIRDVVDCDRCGTEMEVEERKIGELGEGVDKEGSVEPAFILKFLDTKLRYDDLCDNCKRRLETLKKEAGPVSRSRRGGTRKKKTNTGTEAAGEIPAEKNKKKGKRQPPAKPQVPASA
jgi:hypothetical protein